MSNNRDNAQYPEQMERPASIIQQITDWRRAMDSVNLGEHVDGPLVYTLTPEEGRALLAEIRLLTMHPSPITTHGMMCAGVRIHVNSEPHPKGKENE